MNSYEAKGISGLKASLKFCGFYFHGGYKPTKILEFVVTFSRKLFQSELSQAVLRYVEAIRGLWWLHTRIYSYRIVY